VLGAVLASGFAWFSAESAPAVPAKSDPIGALIASQQTNLPMVIGLKLTENANRAQFTVELSDPIEAHAYTLSNPDRVVIDMPEVLWRVQNDARPSGRGLIRSYRYGLFRKGNFRFVVDLGRPVKVAEPKLLPPEGGAGFQLVLDFAPTTADDFAAHAGWPANVAPGASSATAQAPAPAAKSAVAKRTIVVDAGHGGIDPGTHGSSGIQEKDLVLLVAKELRKALEATGRYRVQLTRDNDVFIPLRERVNIARAAHGDLFVSLHADSNDHRDIRGASVYTLSEDASDREAARLAEKENMSDAIAGVDLTGENSPVASILIDLAQRDTMNRSVRLAEGVLGALPAATTVRPTNPHRAAGFAVLKAPDVPSVLVELGYLTNLDDERVMMTQAWRTRVAQALAGAIDAHFPAPPGLTTRQAANP
jgi:N-acetylmuramoyl-L-alanine amidase